MQLYDCLLLTRPVLCLVDEIMLKIQYVLIYLKHSKNVMIDSCNIAVERYLFVVYQVGLNSPIIDY